MKFSQKKYLKIISHKPDIFGTIPHDILTEERIAELRQIPCLAVGEIYCCADWRTLMESLSLKKPDAFLPTVSYTGTEFGNWLHLQHSITALKELIEKELRIFVAEPVLLGSPAFWRSMNGRYACQLQRRFGFDCRWFGCRLYSLALRVPLCKIIGSRILIAGSDTMSNGTAAHAAHYYRMLLSNFGIELFDGHQARPALIDTRSQPDSMINGADQMRCVLHTGTCCAEAEESSPNRLTDFFELFAIPAAAKIISRALSAGAVDYDKEVSETLMPVAASRKKRTRSSG